MQRFDVDPLIVQVTPPSYAFPDQERQREIERTTAYKLTFFLEVVTVALNRIKQIWPEAYEEFNKFVRVIIHVTDATFRSCSADRYAGVILLSADDESLLEVEESLIHEYGHQILYNLMELDPIFLSNEKTGQMFTLPWSGTDRDFYGYFHAFYIYIFLACYFERVVGRSEDEDRRASDRLSHILRGLIKALPDFEEADGFTPKGKHLFKSLSAVIYELKARHSDLL